jgi:hypothetical protein
MRPAMLDPTAGERARAIRARPGSRQPILDPTDPRYNGSVSAEDDRAIEARRICDPTDPECGEPAV